jgi:hypothetical protein
MQRHNILPGELNKRSFSVGIRWLGGRSVSKFEIVTEEELEW